MLRSQSLNNLILAYLIFSLILFFIYQEPFLIDLSSLRVFEKLIVVVLSFFFASAFFFGSSLKIFRHFNRLELILFSLSNSIILLSMIESLNLVVRMTKFTATFLTLISVFNFLLSIVFNVFLRRSFFIKSIKISTISVYLADAFLIIFFVFLILTVYETKSERSKIINNALKYESAAVCDSYIGYLRYQDRLGFSDSENILIIRPNLEVDLTKCFFPTDYRFRRQIESKQIRIKILSQIEKLFFRNQNRIIVKDFDEKNSDLAAYSIIPETYRYRIRRRGRFFLSNSKLLKDEIEILTLSLKEKIDFENFLNEESEKRFFVKIKPSEYELEKIIKLD